MGNELDSTRWNRNVRVNQAMTVADGTLNIPLTNSDIYQTTNTTPNIVLQDLPAGRFEVTTKLTLPAVRGYQQGGLIVYGDDNNYLKLVYSGRSTAAAGSKAANVIQFAKEVNGIAAESNSTNLGATFPDTVWLRLTSTDGNVVIRPTAPTGPPGSRSRRRTAPRTARPDRHHVAQGRSARPGHGRGAATTSPREFDYFTITPDNTAIRCNTAVRRGAFNGTHWARTWTSSVPGATSRSPAAR